VNLQIKRREAVKMYLH